MKVDTHRLSKGLFPGFCSPCWVALYHCFAPALTTFQSAAAPLVSLRAFLLHRLVLNTSFKTRILVHLRTQHLSRLLRNSRGEFQASWIRWKQVYRNNHVKSKRENSSAQRAIDCKDLSTLQKLKLTNVRLWGNFVTTPVSPQIDTRGSCIVTKWRWWTKVSANSQRWLAWGGIFPCKMQFVL